MYIEIYEKPVPTKFVMVYGEEFELNELCACLEQISETEENDNFGDYSLREYQLYYPKTMNKLVKLGLVKNYTGSRMADLYCMKDKDKVGELLDTLYKLDV